MTDATEQLSQIAAPLTGCRLVVVSGDGEGQSFDLPKGQAVIGSADGTDLTLSDSAISGQHARVEISPEGIRVTDLNSTNGTYYLGTRIGNAVVSPGAVLTLGRTRIAVSSRELPRGEAYSQQPNYGTLRGSSPAARRMYSVLERLETVDYTILIQGETGVGKELVAHEVHSHSNRRNKPLEILDCGAVPSHLAESELFGHVRGAFTGAVASHEGVFERANGGTVFLDEVGELPVELQPKLLRVLERQQFRPVGGTQTKTVDVRVIAATNRDLREEVREGRFREDLFFRLNVVTVWVPPLRDRREDIPELVRRFVKELAQDDLNISPATLELFTCAYDWPGNVRELRNAIARVLALGSLPDNMDPNRSASAPSSEPVDLDEPFHEAKKRLVDAFEHDYLSNQLDRAEQNLAKAARMSGMDRSYFKRLLRRHGLLPKRE